MIFRIILSVRLLIIVLPILFRVTTNGYYFFIFSSENEIEQNYVRAMFNLKKVVYDVSDPVQQCTNQSQKCILPLDFLSNEQVRELLN